MDLGRIGTVLVMLVALPMRASLEQATAEGPTSKEGYVQGADGVRLFYRSVGTGSTVGVLLHGGPGSNMNAVWPDLQRLASRRTIVMYDQRGGGRSEIIKNPARLTSTDHVRDLEALRQELGLSRFALIGESWGAGLAILYAVAHPNHVERLVLIGPMPPTRAILERRMDESDAMMGLRRRLDEVRRAMPGSPDPIGTCREFFGLYLKQFFVTPEGMARRRGSSCDGPPEGVRNYFVVNDATFASLGNWDFRPLLAKLPMPAVVIEGEQSLPTAVESARMMAQALPNATLLLVAKAGHYPQVEQPEVFFQAVERFLTVEPSNKRYLDSSVKRKLRRKFLLVISRRSRRGKAPTLAPLVKSRSNLDLQRGSGERGLNGADCRRISGLSSGVPGDPGP